MRTLQHRRVRGTTIGQVFCITIESGCEVRMFRHVNIVGSITIALPKQTLVEMLWNISRIPEFDLKADRVDVKPETEKTGAYEVWGRFLGISWNRPFLYFL